MKIVVDCAHGAGYHVAPPVFHELGAEVIAIGAAPDGFKINDKVGATSPQALQKAVDLAPSLTDARLGLADVMIKQGHLVEAAEECKAALNDSPEMANVYLKLAEISSKLQKNDECLEYCCKARELAPYTHPPKGLLAVFCMPADKQFAFQMLQKARTALASIPFGQLYVNIIRIKRHFLSQTVENVPDRRLRRAFQRLRVLRFPLYVSRLVL